MQGFGPLAFALFYLVLDPHDGVAASGLVSYGGRGSARLIPQIMNFPMFRRNNMSNDILRA